MQKELINNGNISSIIGFKLASKKEIEFFLSRFHKILESLKSQKRRKKHLPIEIICEHDLQYLIKAVLYLITEDIERIFSVLFLFYIIKISFFKFKSKILFIIAWI